MNSENADKVLKSFVQIADVIKNDSSMTIQNPVLGDVVFANGTFGNLEKKNTGGFGIKHIIEGRYRKDKLSKEEISALLYLIKDTVETAAPDNSDKPRLNIRKNGVFVGISKQWMGNEESWVITGFAENDENNVMKKEATDAIKAVNAQYGYAPEFLSIGKQVGAVIASVDRITQNKNLSSLLPRDFADKTSTDTDFKNVLTKLDKLIDENHKLKKENAELHKQLDKRHFKKREIEWER